MKMKNDHNVEDIIGAALLMSCRGYVDLNGDGRTRNNEDEDSPDDYPDEFGMEGGPIMPLITGTNPNDPMYDRDRRRRLVDLDKGLDSGERIHLYSSPRNNM